MYATKETTSPKNPEWLRDANGTVIGVRAQEGESLIGIDLHLLWDRFLEHLEGGRVCISYITTGMRGTVSGKETISKAEFGKAALNYNSPLQGSAAIVVEAKWIS